MSIGPPVYWVVKGPLNYSDTDIQNMMCGGVGCSDYSLTVQLYTASQQSEMYNYIYCNLTPFPLIFLFKVLTFQHNQLHGLMILKTGLKQAVVVNIFIVTTPSVRTLTAILYVVHVRLVITLT